MEEYDRLSTEATLEIRLFCRCTMTKLSTKYSMVVPEEVRKDMKLQPGMKVDLVKNERGEWVLIKVEEAKNWLGRYPSSRRAADEMAELRGRDTGDFD